MIVTEPVQANKVADIQQLTDVRIESKVCQQHGRNIHQFGVDLNSMKFILQCFQICRVSGKNVTEILREKFNILLKKPNKIVGDFSDCILVLF